MSQEFLSTRTVYLDQAATSRPKAAGVGDAMRFHLDTNREEFREELNKRLSKHGITIIGDSKYYGYNAIM